MNIWKWMILPVSVLAMAQQPNPAASRPAADVMIAAVSRDTCMFCGGIGPGRWAAKGTVQVEPVAYLAASSEWKDLPCGKGKIRDCRRFAREYLKKPHTYTVISKDGFGATIQAAPTTLSECLDYSGPGTYAGAPIAKSALAASATESFAAIEAPTLLSYLDATPIRNALASVVPAKVDSLAWIQVFSLRLEGQDVFVVQRNYSDFPSKHRDERRDYILTIGKMEQGRFHILHWKKNTEDEEERIVGAIHLRNGRDFLITTVSDPESQFFRIYGIRDGHLALVYSGGGSSC